MELLAEIKDGDVRHKVDVKNREASRVVLFDQNALIPLLFVSKCGYHKLPGGGIKKGESRKKALIREVREEAGCLIEIVCDIGKIIEYRAQYNLLQVSYCYIAGVLAKGVPDFTERELKQGFQVKWMSLDESIETVAQDKPRNYEGEFVKKRDIIFLNKAKQYISEFDLALCINKVQDSDKFI